MKIPHVTVLFARCDSNYKLIPTTDVWDAQRNALFADEGLPVIAHPPCRAWGRLKHFAKPRAGEKDLALWAIDRIRMYGGVLEHPAHSSLWKEKPLPFPGQIDDWGGWTLEVEQFWWGHRAQKKTWLYIVGAGTAEIPAIPIRLGNPECVIRFDMRRSDGTRIRKGDSDYRSRLGPAEREHTPPAFAKWLLELAAVCGNNMAEMEAG